MYDAGKINILQGVYYDTQNYSKLPLINSSSIVDPSCYGGALQVELSFFKARVVNRNKVIPNWESIKITVCARN